MNTFSISDFASECKVAMAGQPSKHEAAKTYLEGVIERFPAHKIVEALEEAVPAGANVGEMIVHASPELTMLYARVPARFRSGIHNHTVFACIGQLTGEETNTVYQPDGEGLAVESTTRVQAGQVIGLPADAIHHIENPTEKVSASLHIYGGDFGALMDDRSLWSTEEHKEKSFSFPALLEESVKAMRSDGNTTGLQELVKAIPAAKPLVGDLSEA